MNPPRWSERLLRLLLIDRDRDTVSGDLLEEYRATAVPTRGVRGARWWYRRQVAGFVWQAAWLPLAMGAAFGSVLGILNLIGTARQPLADDDVASMAAWVALVVCAWGAASVGATWRTHRFGDAVKAGAMLGIATILVFHVAAIVRVNLFLDLIRHRDDWQNLVARFDASGYRSLRAYANVEYLSMTPTIVAVGAFAGSVSGMLAGLIMRAMRRLVVMAR
jgi:hypothetical protein